MWPILAADTIPKQPELVARLELHGAGESAKMEDGRNPCVLKVGELKKALASRGLPCSLDLESRDELTKRLVEARRAEAVLLTSTLCTFPLPYLAC